MATLLHLLSQYPIVQALIPSLPIGSLFHLSRLNSDFRATLHGFPTQEYTAENSDQGVRPGLHIGEHQTKYWQRLKSSSQQLCSEPQHTKGPNVRGCTMCSMPVCEGCIVKSSFGKRENTFQNRRRHLCAECWASGKSHEQHQILPPGHVREGRFCVCTAKDGWLCLGCKVEQRSDLQVKLQKCAGEGCTNDLDVDKERYRVCLWCDLPLFGKPSREESRRDYNSRHLFAKSMSFAVSAKEAKAKNISKEEWINREINRDSGLSDIVGFKTWYTERKKRLQDRLSATWDQTRKNVIRPLEHLAFFDYSQFGIPNPSTKQIMDSKMGKFRYDIDFLLAFHHHQRMLDPRGERRLTSIITPTKHHLDMADEDDGYTEPPPFAPTEGSLKQPEARSFLLSSKHSAAGPSDAGIENIFEDDMVSNEEDFRDDLYATPRGYSELTGEEDDYVLVGGDMIAPNMAS